MISNIKTKAFKTFDGKKLTQAPYFDIDSTVIRGITAMMLSELIDLD
ncbi:MAG TPA: hypothetical protein PLO29_00895 [Paludibacter sp.]|nr:hypothetical protein [Paludibacter sp.]